jgi:hypothetical protein
MSSAHNPEIQPESPAGHDDADVPLKAKTAPVPPARLWAWALTASLAAGLAAWLMGERLLVAYRNELAPAGGAFPPPEVTFARIAAEQFVASLTFAALGAQLGLALGIAGAGVRRSLVAAGLAGLAGFILGGIAAAVAARGLLPIYFAHQKPLDHSLALPLLTHAGVAAAAGLTGGLALGLGLGGWAGRTLVGGLLGAAGGATLYEFVGAIAFPSGRTSEPISAAPATRLFFFLAVALLTAAGAVWMARNPSPSARPARHQTAAPPD